VTPLEGDATVLIDPYVSDKLRELDAELARRTAPFAGRAPTFALSPVVRVAGRVLRRMGEGLESWAAPTSAESDGARSLAAQRDIGSSLGAADGQQQGC